MAFGRTWRLATIVCLVAPVAACSGAGTDQGDGSSAKVATIGFLGPLEGADAARGVGSLHAVELAIEQANQANAIPGWRLQVVGKNDDGDGQSARAAQELASDPSVVAVVGGLFSGATKESAPVLAKAGVPQVATTASNPALARGESFASRPQRSFPTLFRVCPPDDVYGPGLAAYLSGEGIRRVVTVSDTDDYGVGLVDAFTQAFTKAGGTVVDAGTVASGSTDFGGTVSAVAKAKPQAVMFGGYDREAGALSRQLKKAGVNAPLVAGDGAFTPDYIPLAGVRGSGDLAALGGAPAQASEAGKAFLHDYQRKLYDMPAAVESPLAYDAARTVIEALKTSLTKADTPANARGATVSALAGVSLDGLGGKVAFDQFGENTSKTLTVYRVSGGRWEIASVQTST